MIKTQRICWIFLTIVLISNISLGASLLNKGQEAPHQGLLFSIEEAKKTQIELMELDFCKQNEKENKILIDLQKMDILKYKELSNTLEIQRTSLIKERQQFENKKLVENGLYFLLGIILTSGIVYVTK